MKRKRKPPPWGFSQTKQIRALRYTINGLNLCYKSDSKQKLPSDDKTTVKAKKKEAKAAYNLLVEMKNVVYKLDEI